MKFFLPFWPADGIYENFDPWKETWSGEKKRIWEVYEKPPIDGVLVSLENIKRNKEFMANIQENGIHSALDYYGEVFADCGAFTYKFEEKTPDPIETLSKYIEFGVNYGVTVDHLMINATPTKVLSVEDKISRWDLTIKNAEIMFNRYSEHSSGGMKLIGVTQGYDVESYARGVEKLVEIGFDYLALGGMVRKRNKFITKVLQEIHPIISKKNVKLHLFGIGRPDFLNVMRKYGVTSFDNAFHRKAWMDAKKNYYINNEYYSAIRIKQAKRNNLDPLVEKQLIQQIKKEDYNIEKLLNEIEIYDPESIISRKQEYLKTLKNNPWNMCDCILCKEYKIHMCILRGNERNMRRGFHNIYQFYKHIKKC